MKRLLMSVAGLYVLFAVIGQFRAPSALMSGCSAHPGEADGGRRDVAATQW
jgi:hypothetical protein